MKIAALVLGLLLVGLAAYGQTYHYDAADRLTNVIFADGTQVVYTYDAAGNRLSQGVQQALAVIATQPADIAVPIGKQAQFSIGVVSSLPVTYQWYLNGIAQSGMTSDTWPAFTVVGYHDGWKFRCVATNAAGSVTSRDAVLTVIFPPAITTQAPSQTVQAGQSAALSIAAASAAPITYQWYRNGAAVAGGTAATLALNAVAPTDAGIYDAVVSSTAGNVLSKPTVVGVVPPTGSRTAGSVYTKDAWQNIHRPNGNIYDQFLLSGTAGTINAQPNKIARMSFLDPSGSIVQVEISGFGAVTVVLDNATGPAPASKYNQPTVSYMQGAATVILAGADETTNLSIYSVGTATNPGVTLSNQSYNGWANIVTLGIVSRNGKLGGIHQGDTAYAAISGFTGIYAPTVNTVIQMPVVIHNASASIDAVPFLFFGPGGQINIKVAGGNLAQPNGDAITVSGLAKVLMSAGQDSCGRAAPAQTIQTHLLSEDGTDLTLQLVGGP